VGHRGLGGCAVLRWLIVRECAEERLDSVEAVVDASDTALHVDDALLDGREPAIDGSPERADLARERVDAVAEALDQGVLGPCAAAIKELASLLNGLFDYLVCAFSGVCKHELDLIVGGCVALEPRRVGKGWLRQFRGDRSRFGRWSNGRTSTRATAGGLGGGAECDQEGADGAQYGVDAALGRLRGEIRREFLIARLVTRGAVVRHRLSPLPG